MALVVTIIVVLFDASLKSRSPGPARTLSGQAWIDRVLPVIAASSTEGKVITQIRTDGLGMPATSIRAQLQQVAQEAQANYQAVVALGSPAGAGGAPGLLQACLAVRAEAAHSAADAMVAVLAGPSLSPAPESSGASADPNVQALATAGRDFSISDRAYQLFSRAIPASLGVTMPGSTWTTDSTIWDVGGLQVFLAALRSGTSLAPVHQVTVEAVSTNPPPVGLAGSVQDIAPTSTIAVTIVVADTGNQPERNLTISAAVTPAAPGRGGAVRDFTSLSPGESYATTIGPLVPVSGSPTTLTVTVTGAPGSSGSATPVATRTLQIEVAAPPPPTTTSTTSSSTNSGSTTSTSAGAAAASG